MVETATGLVLRTRPLTETSLIIHWLTPELGRLATVAKGARRPKSSFRGKLDLFYLADFSFARSRRSELHTLREVSLRETHPGLRQELGHLQQACYCAALVEQATETDTALPGIFDLICGLLAHLPIQTVRAQTIFAFELKLLQNLGLQPDFEQTKLNPGTRQLAHALALSDWPMITRLKPIETQAKELDQFLHGFLIYHLGKLPKGRDPAMALH
ncbi:MAG TPA: DNA repair protein RecO [Candidatus Binatia bacterium]|jgi:DNA repair protein RecO (recombination protein O)|nr:DNA repair protein RecO [Candidatus Binatia bacterium]